MYSPKSTNNPCSKWGSKYSPYSATNPYAKVTNWTLEKPSGRLILNVDVAYGSDTALVRKLLLATANSHPAVVRDGSVPEPMVMFLGFGVNALHMELRCFIKDIMEKFFVMSDLYFAMSNRGSPARTRATIGMLTEKYSPAR